MIRTKWLWAALLALPFVVAGAIYAHNQQARSYVCPITGEELPCEKCCPLNDGNRQTQKAEGFICPVTGEELPCEKCCPLNGAKAEVKAGTNNDDQPFICPVTGEELACPDCCPLTKSK